MSYNIKTFPGLSPYIPMWEAMMQFTQQRQADTPDEIWVVEHEPVYTLGQAGKTEHILNPKNIPVVHCNRGGQVTYHGPGQVVLYPLLDLHHYQLFVKEYVHLLEETALRTLYDYGVTQACRQTGAPGIYVPYQGKLAKIAALGVKVTHGCTYHGLAFNVHMDLSPFKGINPCGYAGLQTIDLHTLGIDKPLSEVRELLLQHLIEQLEQVYKRN